MNSFKASSILFVSLNLFVACTNKDVTETLEVKSNQITLIFKNPPSNWRVYRKAGGYTPAQCEIEYIDDHFIPIKLNPDTTQVFDTLVVSTKREIVEFRHDYKGFDKLSYLFQNGDTVLFTYRDKTPTASILNRAFDPIGTNLDLYKKEILTPDDYPAYIKFSNPFFFMEKNYGDFKQEVEKVVNAARDSFPIEANRERMFLDSLKQNNLISQATYSFNVKNTMSRQKTLYLQSLLGNHSNAPLLRTLAIEAFKIPSSLDMEFRGTEENMLGSENDSLLYFGFQKDIIDWLYYHYFGRMVGSISSTNYVNNIATAGSSIPNYLELSDTINSSNLLSTATKKVLGFKNIQNIIENFSIDEAKTAFDQFSKNVEDTLLVNYIKRKYMLDEDSTMKAFDMRLISTDSEHLLFKELLEKHHGKLIYIDFWQSTCRPCIKELKFSSKLDSLYEEKDFVQIHISSEREYKRWLSACIKYNLEYESYYVENRYTSKELEDMQIQYIPHYILYDKEGNLINKFAPRPSNKQLVQLLDQYIDG